MRGIGFLVSLLPAITAIAQNWALLNPAYRYNYSNDGTDTISNQIRVMDVDTLGPDSFRYELNKVAVRCETCSDPMLALNRPQFLQGEVIVGPDLWLLRNPGSLVLRPSAAVGSTWTYDTLTNITATISAQYAAQVFGVDQQVKTISLSNGDSVLISENFGVLSFGDYRLIGVNGPGLGRVIPSLQEVYPYQSGDVVEYRIDHMCFDESGPWGDGEVYKFNFSGSTLFDDHIEFAGSRITQNFSASSQAYPWAPFPYASFNGNAQYSNSWVAGPQELPGAQLTGSYPGQVMRIVMPQGFWWIDTVTCVAKHSIDDSGRYVFGCEPIPLDPSDPSLAGYFVLLDAETMSSTDTIPWYPYDGPVLEPAVIYRSGVGLEKFLIGEFKCGAYYRLVGSVIGGDTIGTVHIDEAIIHLNLSERASEELTFFPSPASDRVTIAHAPIGAVLRLTDAEGRLVRAHRISSPNEIFDVHDLESGVYLLLLEGCAPRRLVKAR